MTHLEVVLVPDVGGNLCVCSLDQLVANFTRGMEVDDAIEDAQIDEFSSRDPMVQEKIKKVYALNDTGDAGAYWA